MANEFSWRARLRSFVYAGRGLRTLLASQHNARLHFVATLLTLAAALACGLDRSEWLVLIVTLVAVWVAEALNTAVELLCDVVSPEFHPLVAKAKDVAAAAVLLSALGAVAVGALLFGPHVLAAIDGQRRVLGASSPAP